MFAWQMAPEGALQASLLWESDFKATGDDGRHHNHERHNRRGNLTHPTGKRQDFDDMGNNGTDKPLRSRKGWFSLSIGPMRSSPEGRSQSVHAASRKRLRQSGRGGGFRPAV